MSAGERHLARVRAMPCAFCLRPPPSDPHHFGPRVGRKASDYSVVPLCREHHDQFHVRRSIGHMSIEETRDFLWRSIVATLITIIEKADAELDCPIHGIEARRCVCASR